MNGQLRCCYSLSTISAGILCLVFPLLLGAQKVQGLSEGISHVWHSDYSNAGKELKEVIHRAGKTRIPTDSLGVAYMYLGRTEQLVSHYDTALVYFHKAHQLFTRSQNYNLLVECKSWLAEYHRSLTQFDEGLKYLNEVAEMIDHPTVSDFSKAVFYSRSAAYSNEVDHDPTRHDALYFSGIAQDLAVKIGHTDLQATAINEIGFAYENMGNEKAIDCYLDAYNLWDKSGNRHYAINSLINVVRELVKRRRYDDAVYYARIGYQGATDTKLDHAREIFASQIMQVEERRGNYEEALKYSHIYHDLYEIEMAHRWSESIIEVERKYDLARQQEKTASERARAEVALANAQRNRSQRNYLIILVTVLVASLIAISLLTWKIRSRNRDLEQSLDEKKILLKEVYHRVKNNLAFLNSLLFLRARAAHDDSVKTILAECQSRIHSMSILHQQLYQDGGADAGTNFRDYCITLLSDLRDASVGDDREIEFDVKGNISGLNMNNAVLVGLVINELAMNSIKHAVSTGCLKIKIGLKKTAMGYEIDYSDNGQGLPEGVTLENDSGFGFRMIRLLIKQLNSTIYYNHDKACSFQIQMNNL